MIELLEQTGALRVLLAIAEQKRFITELKSSSVNPNGILSLDALYKVRHNLVQLGLITESMDEGPRPRTWLTITEKGRRVAELVKRIQGILEKE